MLQRLKDFYRSLSAIQLALGFSVLFHVLLITVRFVDPASFNRVFKEIGRAHV